MRPQHGFSLLELACAVAITGVLAAVALPSYRGYALHANRAAGKVALLEIASRQESWFAEHKAYAGALSAWYPADAQGYVYFLRDGSVGAATTPATIYRARLAIAGDLMGYRVELDPVNAQARDTACGSLSYDQLGSRGASGPLGPACWH